MKGFLVAGGSVPGTDHTMPGQPGWTNNHDAWTFQNDRNYLIGVVCDGCGSTSHPEVGSRIGSHLVVNRLSELMRAGLWETKGNIPGALKVLKEGLVGDIEKMARMTYGEAYVDQAVYDHFLFTVVGVAMGEEWTAVFSFGDGVYAVRGEAAVIPAGPGNAPAYLGQCLVPGLMPKEYLHFVAQNILPTKYVQSILIGTDGVNDLASAADELLPGKQIPVGPLSQFWTDDKYVKNPDCIRRHLALVNLETIDESGERPRITKGLLHDDTTLVVERKMEGE